MDNEWKNSLRERFSDYSVPEPEGLWEGIEQGIAGKSRRKMLPVWWLSGGLAAAAAITLVVVLRPDRTADTPVMQDSYAESVQTEPVLPADTLAAEPVEVPGSKSVPFAVKSRQTLLSEAMSAESVSVPVSEETIPDAVPDFVEEMPADVPVESESDQPVLEANEVERTLSVKEKEEFEKLVTGVPEPTIDIRPRKRFSIGAYREGGDNAASEHSRGYGLNKTGAYLTRATYNGGSPHKTSDLMEMLSNNRESSYYATHAAPVRVGVTAAWELSPYLSLTSGVNWTSLTSNFSELTTGRTQTSIRQELGYLGIPLRLEAGFQPLKRLRLYAGAGGMVEKGLMSTAKTESYIDDHLEDTVTDHPDTGGLLWSLGASAGAEYRFNRIFGIYLAPGIEYHFDNGAEVRSAYTEKPLHWNVALGVRFNFGID